jgi:hypothetical protein
MEEKRRVFAFIADEEVFHFMTIPDDPQFAGAIAGLQSKPLLLDVTHLPDLAATGPWKYINGEFIKPDVLIEQPTDQVDYDESDYEVE